MTGNGAPATVQWSKLSGPGSVTFGNFALAATTGTAAFGGSYTLQLAANDGAITTVADVAASIAQTYSAWASQHNLTGANALGTANPAQDGITNLMKYALGLDPAVNYCPGTAEPRAQVTTVGGKNYLMLAFTGVATDVTYLVEAANDLTTWNVIYTYSGDPAPGAVTVWDTQPMTPEVPCRFLRLHVTQP